MARKYSKSAQYHNIETIYCHSFTVVRNRELHYQEVEQQYIRFPFEAVAKLNSLGLPQKAFLDPMNSEQQPDTGNWHGHNRLPPCRMLCVRFTVIDTDESLIILYRYFGGLSVTSQMSWVQMRILANQIDAGIVITWLELKSDFGSGQVGAVAGPRLPHADAQFVTGTLSGKNTISYFISHWNFANHFVYLGMP